ncbi:hypothetical protein D3C85_1545390 [compost metagenome]
MHHRPTNADRNLTVYLGHMHVTQVKAKQRQEAAEVVGQVLAEARIKDKTQFVITHLQIRQVFELLTNFRDQVR